MEEQQLFFNELMNCLKILQNNSINFPEYSMQSKEKIVEKSDSENIFELVINRKGHYNKEKMTYLMNSKRYKGLLVRLDVTGAPHFNYEENRTIPTPHLHIMDEEHNYGRIAVPLDEIKDFQLHKQLSSYINDFLVYNNVEVDDVNVQESLL